MLFALIMLFEINVLFVLFIVYGITITFGITTCICGCIMFSIFTRYIFACVRYEKQFNLIFAIVMFISAFISVTCGGYIITDEMNDNRKEQNQYESAIENDYTVYLVNNEINLNNNKINLNNIDIDSGINII